MAPTGRGALRPYQPSKFQPFIIVCLFVTVIVVGFNFWNLMKKNSLLLIEIGKVQGDFKRMESERKDCHVQFKEAEKKKKQHEDADHEKEILLEDTRRIVEDLKAEAETLRQNITKLLSQIASAELFGSTKENKSRSECEQRLEEMHLQMLSSCVAEKEKLQVEAADQLNTMKKQLKLQFQETQQLDQMLQQQKQHPTEQEKKELQPLGNSQPVDNNNVQRYGDIQKQQQQRQQQEDNQLQQNQQQQNQQQQNQQQQNQQQQNQQQKLQLLNEEQQQRLKQREIHNQNQINVQDDQKLSPGQQLQSQQGNAVGGGRRKRKFQANGEYHQIGKQSSGMRLKMNRTLRRQAQGEKLDPQDQEVQSKDDYRLRQGGQPQGEHKERTERDQGEEVVERVPGMQPPRSNRGTNDDEPHLNAQVPGVVRDQLFKRSDQNATVLAAARQRELAASESKSRVPDQPDENLPRPDNNAANGDAAEHLQKRDDVGLIRKEDNERVDLPASNELDRQDLRQDEQENEKNPHQPPMSFDPEKPPEGNADV